MQSIITKSAKETQRLAAELAKKFIKNRKNKKALVIALQGELGAGKTTFIKGFTRALKVIEKVLSPTFVLIHRHHLKSGDLYHIDAYRLKSEKDLLKLNIKEIFNNPKNIILIEWADRVKRAIPKTAVWIYFKHINKNKRRISAQV